MNIEQWFPTTIAYSDGNLLDELNDYYKYCYELTEGIPNGRPFIGSRLISTLNYHDPAWNKNITHDPRFKNLHDLAVKEGEKFAEYLGYKYELEMTDMWVNRIGPHDFHEYHNHVSSGNALIVGCFYVSAPPRATIRFKSPFADMYSPADPTADTPFNSKIVQFDCIPGRIMFFRANVVHGYDPHLDDSIIKFSIPFNLTIKTTKSVASENNNQ
jgi:Putative 2OG-Fe(II) oxygenase